MMMRIGTLYPNYLNDKIPLAGSQGISYAVQYNNWQVKGLNLGHTKNQNVSRYIKIYFFSVQ